MFAKKLKLTATTLLLVLTNRSFSVQDVKSFESSAVHHSFKTSDTMNRLGAVTSSNNPRKAINNIIGDEINYLAKLPDESPY